MKSDIRSAMLSPCGAYRYWLSRRWDETLPDCAFIMLNPSTADASKDDPTIRRVMGFAESWGFGGVNVYNLFALRATDPRRLRDHADPIGPENDGWLGQIPREAVIVAAWGSWGDYRGRGLAVRRMFLGRLSRLGATERGHPRHPLYVPAATKHEPFNDPFEMEAP